MGKAMIDDVIVIGGGITGCATAHYLAEAGARVSLLEAGELNAMASSANAGSLHAQIPHEPFVTKGGEWARNFVPAVRFFRASLDLWRGIEQTLGEDLEVGFGGGLLVASNAKEMAEVEAKAAIEREAGLVVNLLDQRALREIAPYVSDRMIGGAFCPDEGKANPLIVAPAFAASARRLGANVRTGEHVLAIERVQGGYAVRTASAGFRAERIVNAAGIASGDIAAMLGFGLATQSFPIQATVTEPAEPLVRHLLYSAGRPLTMKQTRIGTILIGGGWPARLDAMGRPVVDPVSLAANLGVALEAVPAIAPLQVVRTWAAMVNGTEDWLPIIGEIPGAPGAFIAYVPWMGFTGGPAAARIVADLLLGRSPSIDGDFASFEP